jgi:hypothetical protein
MILVYAVTEKKIYRRNIEVLLNKTTNTVSNSINELKNKKLIKDGTKPISSKEFHFIRND